MSEETPEELLLNVADGCRDSFAKLYKNFSGSLFGIAYGVTKNHAEAQEVLQEVFLSIWKKANQYNPKLGKATTWIIQLTRNRSIDRLRKRQRRDAGQDRLEAEPAPETVDGDPRGNLIQEETAQKIRDVLETLPEDQKTALKLAFYEGLTQSQIAEKLQEPLGTIKSRIRRAMESVRLAMTETER